MSKKISVTDIFEEADIFAKIRKSAEDTVVELAKMKAELVSTSKLVKEGVKNSSVTNTKGIQEFTNFTKKANQLQREAIELTKQEAQAKKLILQATAEEVKLKKMADAEIQKQLRATEKLAKVNKEELSVYKQLSNNTRDLKTQSKELAATMLQMANAGQKSTSGYAKLEQQFKEVTDAANKGDIELKRIDKTVGDNFRNVGNYEGAIKPLKLQLRELTMALQNMESTDPRFQEMANKAGMLKDQIADTAGVIKATTGSGLENMAGAMAKVGQIGIAGFQGIESSMVLLGVENEAVLKSMQKLQALAGLGDALKTLGGLGDMMTEIKAGFTAAISKMGIFKTATIEQTVATQAQTVADEINNAVTAEGVIAKEAKIVVDAESTILKAEDVALTTEQTIATGAQTGATIAQTATTETATVAQTGLNTAMSLNPIALVIVGIIALTAALAGYVMYATKETKLEKEKAIAKKASAQATKDGLTSISAELSASDKLMRQLKDETLSRKEKILKVKEFQKEYPGLLSNMNAETMSIAQINSQLEMNIGLLRLQAKQKAIAALREEEFKKQIIAQTNDVEEHMGFFDKLSEGGVLGFFVETNYDETGAGGANRKKAIADTEAQIAALDKLDAANELEMIALKKKGALVVDIKDYSNPKIDHSAEIKTNAELIAKLQELKQVKQDLNVSEEQLTLNRYVRDKKELDNIYANSKKDEEAKKALFDGKVLLEQKYWNDIKVIEDAADKEQQDRIDKRNKEERDRLNNIAQLEEDARQEYEDAVLTDRQKQERDINDHYFNLIAKAEQYGWDVEALKKKQAEEIAALDKDTAKTAVKTEADKQKEIQAMIKTTSDFFTKQSEKKIANLDKEVAAGEKQLASLTELANSGNIKASESLAEQQKIIDEANRKKAIEQKRIERIKLAGSVLNTYSQKVESGSKNPIADTIKDITLLQAFISSLPAFEKGTEDTGKNGRGVDGKGGFNAILHPNERVVPKNLNDQLKGISNEALTKMAIEYKHGNTMKNSSIQLESALNFGLMISKLDKLNETIQNKPEHSYDVGRISSTLLEFVDTNKKGNTTTYNRYKVRK